MEHPTFSSTGKVPTLLTDFRNNDQIFILGEEPQGNLDSAITTLTNANFHTQPNPDKCFIIYPSDVIMSMVKPNPITSERFYSAQIYSQIIKT
jgi:hypothetical protein